MDRQVILQSILLSSPEIIVILGACLLLFVALMKNKHQATILTGLSLTIIAFAASATVMLSAEPQSAYGGTFVVDGFANFFKAVFYVAAALVLEKDADVTEQEIREFARRRLADFKVPRRVLFLAELPKGPTGKLQRIGLAEKLGLA